MEIPTENPHEKYLNENAYQIYSNENPYEKF